MKLNEFAETHGIELAKAILLAKLSKLSIDLGTELTDDQVLQLEEALEPKKLIARPQLPESTIGQPPNEQIAISEDSPIVDSIAAQTHAKLSQSNQAKNAQAGNLFQAAVRSEYAAGQDTGLLLGLVNQQGVVDAYMSIQQAYASVQQADLSIQATDRANFLSQDNNLLGELQNPCKSFSQSEELLATARSGATATQSDLNQILSDLRDKLSHSATKSE